MLSNVVLYCNVVMGEVVVMKGEGEDLLSMVDMETRKEAPTSSPPIPCLSGNQIATSEYWMDGCIRPLRDS